MGTMRFLILLTFFTSAISLSAQTTELPPLIDRELFFGDPEITAGQLSPDGKYVSFIKPYKGTRNIWVKKADESFEKAVPVTADTTRPIPGYFWSHDSDFILYVQDKGGNENYHIYALNPANAQMGTIPDARALTAGDNIRAFIYAVPKSQPDIMYVGLNDRDRSWHDLYKVNIRTGKKDLIYTNEDRITGWEFDLKGNPRLATRAAEDGSTEILKYENGKFTKIYECGIFETCAPVRFDKAGDKFYMITNKTDRVDLTMLVLYNLNTDAFEVVDMDPNRKVDFGGAIFSDVTDELVATVYTDDKRKIYWKDAGWKAAMAVLENEFPGMEVNITSQTKDEKKWLVYVSSDTDPGAAYLYDLKKKTITFQYRPRPDMPVSFLAEMKPIRYRSSDGMEIQAYLTLPKGVAPKNLPLVVNPHGGPWARDYWGYDSYAQFLANRGYAVLQSNFRGSTGFGKKYLNAGNKEWGQKMQDDLTYGVKALVDEGTVDAERVAIFGGSYGGYATLAGLTFTPEVYACGVSVVGPSNLITLLNSIPPYWESIRTLFYNRMGDPTNPQGAALLKKQSPLFSANKIQAPLMVVQGANDPRVKKAESDQIVVAARELGLPVAYIVAPDEGHGFARPVNNMAFVAAMEKFLAEHLGGRFQKEMKPEVAKRLKEITVDIESVSLPEKMEANTLFLAPPSPVKALNTGTYNYKVKMEMAGRQLDMDMTTTIEKTQDGYSITDAVSSPMGNVTDKVVLEDSTLLPLHRELQQGLVLMQFDYSESEIQGSVMAGGEEQKISAELQGALFADGAGTGHILATLPLKPGYETTFRNFDPQKQAVKVYKMTVEENQVVEVPAGKYEAFKILLKPANGDPGEKHLWISKEDRRVLKTETIIPELNGAVMTAELQ